MPTAYSLQALTDLVPPDHGADERVDWPAARAVLGTGLPADYTQFMATYGAGDFGEEFGVLAPLPADFPQWDPGSIQQQTETFRALWEFGDAPADGPLAGAEMDGGLLLPWGAGNGDEAGWLMSGEDPDDWPVVVWRRHVVSSDFHWALFDCGMVEFLVRTMRAQFPACPLGDESLWGRADPFVHWREQQRRWLAGLDPMTGEPDEVVRSFLP